MYRILDQKRKVKTHYIHLVQLMVVLLLTGAIESCRHSKDSSSAKAQYHMVREFSPKVNVSLKSFLMNSQQIKGRKVAVFDCDGTLLGQVPHYLADEALFEYAESHYQGKPDSLSRAKMNILNHMLNGSNVGNQYIENRIHFFAGLPADTVEQWGSHVYRTHYQHKLYPGMRGVVSNLRKFGFEIWIITASPEFLYQQFISEELDIPENRIIGVKSTIRHGIISNQIVHPVPQDEGKGETIATFIETTPLFVAGNSGGDVDMIKQSTGLKWIINPDDQKQQSSLGGMTLKEYATEHGWEMVYCPDILDSLVSFISDKWNIPVNNMINQ